MNLPLSPSYFQAILWREHRGDCRKIKESSNLSPERARPCKTEFSITGFEGKVLWRFTAKSAGTGTCEFLQIVVRMDLPRAIPLIRSS